MILSWNPAFTTFLNSWPSETIFSSTVLTLLAGWRGPMAANRQHFRTWPSTTVESEVFRLSNGPGSNIRIFIYQNQSVFSTAFLPPYFVNFPCLTLRIPFISFFSFPIALFVSCIMFYMSTSFYHVLPHLSHCVVSCRMEVGRDQPLSLPLSQWGSGE